MVQITCQNARKTWIHCFIAVNVERVSGFRFLLLKRTKETQNNLINQLLNSIQMSDVMVNDAASAH